MICGVQCRVLPFTLKYAKVQSKVGPGIEDRVSYIFVKGFSRAKWTHEDLYRTFASFGPVLSAKVSIDKAHASKGFGYVHYERAEHAQKAIAEVSFELT